MNCRSIALSVGLGLAFLLPALISAGPSFNIKVDQKRVDTQDFSFPSGLRILFQEDHTEPVISVATVIDRGSASDPEGREGTAHLLEHLWFRARYGQLPVEELHRQLGAEANAYTDPDTTLFVTTAPRNALMTLLRLEALRLKTPLAGIDATELKAERQVVLSEHQLTWENSSRIGLMHLYERLFPPAHPYHRLSVAREAAVRDIDLNTLQTFAASAYRPENTTIVIIGDLTSGEVGQAISRTLPAPLLVDPKRPEAPMTMVDPPRRVQGSAPPAPPPVDQSLKVLEGHVPHPTLLLAWSLPGAYREKDPIMQLTTALLDQYMEWYINRSLTILHDTYGQYNESDCWLAPGREASILLCRIVVGEGQKAEKVLEHAVDFTAQLFTTEVAFGSSDRAAKDDAILQVRWQALTDRLRSAEHPVGRTMDLATSAHFTSETAYINRIIEGIAALIPHDVRNFVFEYVNRQRYAAVLITPAFGAASLPGGDEPSFGEHRRQPASTSVENVSTFSPADIQAMVVQTDLSKMRRFKLENGLDVILLPHGKWGIIRSTIFFRGGPAVEPKPGLTWTGEAFQAAISPWRSIQRLGGEWSRSSEADSRTYEMSLLAGNAEEQLSLLWDYYKELGLDMSQKSRRMDFLTSAAEYNDRQLQTIVHRAWLERLLPGHPIARPIRAANIRALENVSRGELSTWMDRIYQPANATLFVVGTFDTAVQEALVRKYLGRWKGPSDQAPIPSPPPPPPPEERRLLLIDDPSSRAAEVTLHCQIEPYSTENFAAQDLLEAFANERAWTSLRTEGNQYSAGADLARSPGGTSILTLHGGVALERSAAAVKTLLGISDALGRGDIDAREFALVKVGAARHYGLGPLTAMRKTARLLEPIRLGLELDVLGQYPERLASVQPAALKQLMQRCAGHEVITIEGPSATLEPIFKGQGLAFSGVR